MGMPSSSWSSPTIANNMLYIGCSDWNVYAFRENVMNQASTSTSANSFTLAINTLILIGATGILVIGVVTMGYIIRKRSNKSISH
jgi:flavorubredoxin